MLLPIWLQAGFWGFVSGAALLIGVAVAYFVPVPQRLIAGIMAFGGGVLIAALAFDRGSVCSGRVTFHGDRFCQWRSGLYGSQLAAHAPRC